jgi:DNA polymerase-3 subunit alpha
MSNDFTHLHLHTQYSLLDGAILIPDLMEYLKSLGMTSCAITDHGWMAGAVDFYKTAKKHGIKPIIGVEAYITEDEDNKEKDKARDNMHMVLLAKDNIGYSKLLQTVSNAALNNFYYKPRISKQNLKELSGHVIATTACLGGIVAKKLEFEKDQYGRATHCHDPQGLIEKEIDFYRQIFQDDLYLELQVWNSGDNYQPVFNKFIKQTGKNLQMPFVLTADAHYLKQGDEKLHEMLMAMQLKMTVEDYRENSEMLYGPHFYVGSPEEMLRRAQSIDCEEAYYNTNKISEACNIDIKLGQYQEPIFNIEETDDYNDFLAWKKNRHQTHECTSACLHA